MPLYRDRGVVLRTYRLGEADRIVVVLTPHHGKVRAVAKGVRKTKSRLGGRLEPASHVDMLLYEGRGELDVVSQADTVDAFPSLRADLDRLGRAVALLEAADQLALDRAADHALYDMLVGALRTLARADAPLVVPGFLLKALALEGFRPQVDACVACGGGGPLVSWAMEDGGLRCAAHRMGPAVSADAVAVLQAILGGRLGAALGETRPPVVSEVDHLALRAFEHHVERRLRSVGTLDRG